VTVHGLVNAVYFVGIFIGMSLGGDDPVDQLSGYMAVAVGTVGLASGLRHIFLAGALGDHREPLAFANQTFFEWEAGFANLAFGTMGLVTSLGGWGVSAMSAVAIGYAIYLLGAAATHLISGWRAGSLRRSLIYACLTITLVSTGAFRVIPAWKP
jgi:hypothetical protein